MSRASKEEGDHQLKRILDDLFLSKKFKEDIQRYRAAIGMPEMGFATFAEWQNWIVDYDERIYIWVVDQGRLIARKYRIPLNYAYYMEAYLVLGTHYSQYQFTPLVELERYYRGRKSDFDPGYTCSLEYNHELDCVDLHMFPGISKTEAVEYLNRHFKLAVEGVLNFSNTRVRTVRKSRSTNKHREIYGAYEAGRIDSYGRILNRDSLPSWLIEMDQDVRRKIISQQKKLRR